MRIPKIILVALLCIALTAPAMAAADLNVTEIHPNLGELFSHSDNFVDVTVTNDGDSDLEKFKLKFEFGDKSRAYYHNFPIVAGGNTLIRYPDLTAGNAGEEVLIRMTVDPDNEITEEDETNNVMEITKTVVNNGYRGKGFTDGEDITTVKDFELQGDVLWSEGDSYYLSGYSNNWDTYAVNWAVSDLPVPEGAVVSGASLYVPYNFDKGSVIPDEVSLSFNEAEYSPEALYTDQKGYGSYNHPYGMLVYDVTDGFDMNGNSALLTNEHDGGGNVSMYGMMLVVVYADDNLSNKRILINEGFDLLQAAEKYATTPEQAVAYAPFTGDAIDTTDIGSASLITFAPSAGDVGEGSSLAFNGGEWQNPWTFAGQTQIGVADCDVTSMLKSEDNQAEFRENGEKFSAAFAMLVISAPDEPEPTPEPTKKPSLSSSSSGGRSQVSVGAASSVGAGEEVSFALRNSAISGVDITAKQDIAKIMLTAERKGSLPSDYGSPEGEVYQYVEVRLYQASEADMDQAVIEFSVPASWLDEHGFSAPDVVLMHYIYDTDSWVPLPTEMLSEAAGEFRFSATSPGLSYFAVIADGSQVAEGAEPAPTPELQAEATPLKVTATDTPAATPTQQSPLIFAPVLSIPALLMMRRRK